MATSFSSADCLRRTRLHAVSAANTFQAVRLLPYLDIHLAGLLAFSTFGTCALIDLISVQRHRIKETVDSAQRSQILAEGPVNP